MLFLFCLISALTIKSDEKDDLIGDIKAQLQDSQNQFADLIESKSKSSLCYSKI